MNKVKREDKPPNAVKRTPKLKGKEKPEQPETRESIMRAKATKVIKRRSVKLRMESKRIITN